MATKPYLYPRIFIKIIFPVYFFININVALHAQDSISIIWIHNFYIDKGKPYTVNNNILNFNVRGAYTLFTMLESKCNTLSKKHGLRIQTESSDFFIRSTTDPTEINKIEPLKNKRNTTVFNIKTTYLINNEFFDVTSVILSSSTNFGRVIKTQQIPYNLNKYNDLIINEKQMGLLAEKIAQALFEYYKVKFTDTLKIVSLPLDSTVLKILPGCSNISDYILENFIDKMKDETFRLKLIKVKSIEDADLVLELKLIYMGPNYCFQAIINNKETNEQVGIAKCKIKSENILKDLDKVCENLIKDLNIE